MHENCCFSHVFVMKTQLSAEGGSDSCISSNPCGRTRFLSGQHCHNQCPAAVVPRVLPKHLPIPQNCVWNARPNVWGVIFLQLVFGKIMLLAELLHFLQYGCISGKLMSLFQEYHKNICIWHRLCTSDKLAVFQSCWFYGVLNFFFSEVKNTFENSIKYGRGLRKCYKQNSKEMLL